MASKRPDLSHWSEAAAAAGLRFLGVAALGEEPDFARFLRWLADKGHAGMSYLEENLALRRDPRGLLPGAQSVLVVGLNYYLGDKLRVGAGQTSRVAQYARWRDYHKTMRRKCEAMLAACGLEGRVVVDSAPILERAVAARAGGGFIGKNTCLIDPKAGSWMLLAEIVTTAAIPAQAATPVDPSKRSEEGGCGTCKRCQVHCPTGALDKDYVLDANKCLAYWTIEHRGTIPETFWPHMARYWFGCDICQLACPYNRAAAPQSDTEFLRLAELPPLFDVATMAQADYERMFGGTPMTRAKRAGLQRNALIAMTVTNDPRLDEALALLSADAEGVVRETMAQVAKWRTTFSA